MSITDELREYAQRFKNSHDAWSGIGDDLTAIADRIDAEHDKALNSVDDAYDSGYNVGYDEGFASADDWLAQHEDAMAEHGWVRLPKDADGEPWNRGDRVIDPKDPDGRVNTVWIAGDNTLITDDHLFIFPANELRHYHAPTVEDVLTEFAYGLGVPVADSYVAATAAKLRLAKEDA